MVGENLGRKSRLTGPGEDKAVYVTRLFTDIAPRYDLANTVLSLGLDVSWRRAAEQAVPPESTRVLDIATGTAKLAAEILKRRPDCSVVGADFTLAMLEIGKKRFEGSRLGPRVSLMLADALRLPYQEGVFDAVTSGFMLRNLTSLPQAFCEMARVLRPGGVMVALDMAPPLNPVMRGLQYAFMAVAMPLTGAVLGLKQEAYSSYLPGSIKHFPKPTKVPSIIEEAGFRDGRFRALSGGLAYLYTGVKRG
jgi:demethylmenaquinone methyltransferase/2-methoxy-6-polyprenyl-1,4-benzoquinol methylase